MPKYTRPRRKPDKKRRQIPLLNPAESAKRLPSPRAERRSKRLDFCPPLADTSIVLIRLGHALLIAALLAAADTHWLILQSVAWTSMLADNLQTNSLKEAVEITFDGKHPCAICQRIAKGKKSEKKSEFASWVKKLDLSHNSARVEFPPGKAWVIPRMGKGECKPRFESPPTPPPRFLPA